MLIRIETGDHRLSSQLTITEREGRWGQKTEYSEVLLLFSQWSQLGVGEGTEA